MNWVAFRNGVSLKARELQVLDDCPRRVIQPRGRPVKTVRLEGGGVH